MATSSFKQRSTPGVYVTELDAFPPSVVGVETAVPAFIGYTQQAEINGKPVFNEAIKINSMVDFETIFGGAHKPIYDINQVDPFTPGEDDYDFKLYDVEDSTEKAYTLDQTDASAFKLYDSMRLFFANGGGKCYVVSVGTYEEGAEIKKDALINGLGVIEEENGPTMLVIPDAILLPGSDPDKGWVSSDFATVTTTMLAQCAKLQDRVAILDVYGSQLATKTDLEEIVTQFHTDVGSEYLNYGMAYFPFLKATVAGLGEFNYTNINKDSNPTINDILTMQNKFLNTGSDGNLTKKGLAVEEDIGKMDATRDEGQSEIEKLNQNLSASLPILGDIQAIMLGKNDTQPCSGAMAGVFTTTDNTRGVWNAPANISLNSVKAPTFKLDNDQQGDLNRPVNGKAIDCIREFTGRGSVVWGARTLDGNSNDWRYIQVRRTLIYIEQSIKNALDPFVFAPNDGNTWTKVTSMVSSFLQGLWSQGGLMGASADEAFSVECGIGSTMTGQDILEGYMIVQVTLQMIRPAEFIELTFKQKMEGVG